MTDTNSLRELLEGIEDYNQKALTFLEKTESSIEIKYLFTGKHFDDDKEDRDIYQFTITRGNNIMIGNFGNSLANREYWTVNGVFNSTLHGPCGPTLNRKSEKNGLYRFLNNYAAIRYGRGVSFGTPTHHPRTTPNEYDILACLTKYDPGTFEDFCYEFGYDTDSRKAEKTYYAVLEEYKDLTRLYSSDELEAMQEIQ